MSLAERISRHFSPLLPSQIDYILICDEVKATAAGKNAWEIRRKVHASLVSLKVSRITFNLVLKVRKANFPHRDTYRGNPVIIYLFIFGFQFLSTQLKNKLLRVQKI